jgi:hypothetical protein
MERTTKNNYLHKGIPNSFHPVPPDHTGRRCTPVRHNQSRPESSAGSLRSDPGGPRRRAVQELVRADPSTSCPLPGNHPRRSCTRDVKRFVSLVSSSLLLLLVQSYSFCSGARCGSHDQAGSRVHRRRGDGQLGRWVANGECTSGIWNGGTACLVSTFQVADFVASCLQAAAEAAAGMAPRSGCRRWTWRSRSRRPRRHPSSRPLVSPPAMAGSLPLLH